MYLLKFSNLQVTAIFTSCRMQKERNLYLSTQSIEKTDRSTTGKSTPGILVAVYILWVCFY